MLSTVIVSMMGATTMKVSAPPWELTGLEKREGAVYQTRFLTLLGERTGLQIISAEDVAAVVGLGRQRQLLGCDDEDSVNCTAELAAALGADALLTGSVAKVGTSYVISLRGVNAVTGSPFATATARLQTQDAVLQFIENEAKEFSVRMTEAFNLYIESRHRVSYTYRPWPWFVMGGGLLVAAVGAIGFGVSRGILASLTGAVAPQNENELIRTGQLLQDGGFSLMMVGAGALAVGTVLLFVTRVSEPVVTVLPLNSGGMITVGGSW